MRIIEHSKSAKKHKEYIEVSLAATINAVCRTSRSLRKSKKTVLCLSKILGKRRLSKLNLSRKIFRKQKMQPILGLSRQKLKVNRILQVMITVISFIGSQQTNWKFGFRLKQGETAEVNILILGCVRNRIFANELKRDMAVIFLKDSDGALGREY